MCFSAPASFGTSFVLALLGVISVRAAGKKSQLMFALIPFLFAVQQFSEGVLWILLSHQNSQPLLNSFFQYTFLFFAFALWPSWIPLSLFLMEDNKETKNLLKKLSIFGMLWSFIILIFIGIFGAQTTIIGNSISYSLTGAEQLFPQIFSYIPIFLIMYCIPIIGSCFISTISYMWFFGLLVLCSCVATYAFFYTCFVSVWCFFAALLSTLLPYFMPLKSYNSPH